jgi:hypothetical protein
MPQGDLRYGEPRRPRPWASLSDPAWCLVVACQACVLAALLVSTTWTTLSGNGATAWPPQNLQDTGLYADFASKTIAPENLPFSPQYPLWSDTAAKSRWINLPAGTWIDASDPDAWRFPVGVRLWKEFRFGRRAETRFIEHTRDGWQFASYVWNADETEAVLVPEQGIAESVPIRDGVSHAIPSRIDCRACHEGGAVPVLGFSALQLSPDRDPNALHAEPLPDGAVTLTTLVQRGLVRGLPARYVDTPPRIDAVTPTERAALGYLHANCGICHNTAGSMASLDMSLTYLLARPPGEKPSAVLTTVGHKSEFMLPDLMDVDPQDRIVEGDPDRSVLVGRISSRQPFTQMPPLGTRIVDAEAVKLIREWIARDLPVRLTRKEEKK